MLQREDALILQEGQHLLLVSDDRPLPALMRVEPGAPDEVARIRTLFALAGSPNEQEAAGAREGCTRCCPTSWRRSGVNEDDHVDDVTLKAAAKDQAEAS